MFICIWTYRCVYEDNCAYTYLHIYSWSSFFMNSILIYILKSICNPKNLYSQGLCDHLQTCTEQQNIWVTQCMCISSWGQSQQCSLPFCWCSYTVNKCPFCSLLTATMLPFLCFLLVISLFKMALKHSANLTCFVSIRRLWRALRKNSVCFGLAYFRHDL